MTWIALAVWAVGWLAITTYVALEEDIALSVVVGLIIAPAWPVLAAVSAPWFVVRGLRRLKDRRRSREPAEVSA